MINSHVFYIFCEAEYIGILAELLNLLIAKFHAADCDAEKYTKFIHSITATQCQRLA